MGIGAKNKFKIPSSLNQEKKKKKKEKKKNDVQQQNDVFQVSLSHECKEITFKERRLKKERKQNLAPLRNEKNEKMKYIRTKV